MTRSCSVDGCNRPHHAKGYCSSHYLRVWKHGHVGVEPLRVLPGDSWKHIQEIVLPFTGPDCLSWPFGHSTAGYAMVWHNRKRLYVHRVVCEAVHGKPPTKRHEAAHACGNRGCVNAGHLYWATPKENQGDRVKHGTSNRGEQQGRSKLKASDVRQIRAMCGAAPQTQIAKMFNVDQSTISDIKNRKLWSWLE